MGKSLDLKAINQGGVPSEIINTTFFIRMTKVKLFSSFTKQKVKMLKFGKNYNFFLVINLLTAKSLSLKSRIASEKRAGKRLSIQLKHYEIITYFIFRAFSASNLLAIDE